jgi:hypothetical protein
VVGKGGNVGQGKGVVVGRERNREKAREKEMIRMVMVRNHRRSLLNTNGTL